LVLWVHRFGLFFTSSTQMSPFNKKPGESPKPSPKHISLGILTNTIVSPVGFRTDLDIGPKGERIVLIAILEQTGLIRLWRKVRMAPRLQGSYFRKGSAKIKDFPCRELQPLAL